MIPCPDCLSVPVPRQPWGRKPLFGSPGPEAHLSCRCGLLGRAGDGTWGLILRVRPPPRPGVFDVRDFALIAAHPGGVGEPLPWGRFVVEPFRSDPARPSSGIEVSSWQDALDSLDVHETLSL